MLRPSLLIASLALLLAAPSIAAGDGTCTNRVAGPPVSANGASVRIIDSTIAFDSGLQRWVETVCFVLTNATQPQSVEASLQIVGVDQAPVCFDAIQVQPLSGGVGVQCLTEPEAACGGMGLASTLTIRPQPPVLSLDSYTNLCCATYTTRAECSELPEAGDFLHVELAAGGELEITTIPLDQHLPSGSCAGEPEMTPASSRGPVGTELLLLAPVWLRRRWWRRLGASARLLALCVGAAGLSAAPRPAGAVEVLLTVDPEESELLATLDLGATIPRSITPAGTFVVDLSLATLPDLHATALQVEPGSSVEASVVWAPPGASLGAFSVTAASLHDAEVSATSAPLPATRIGASTSAFEAGQAADPLAGIHFEIRAGLFELQGTTPGSIVDAERDFSSFSAPLVNQTAAEGRVVMEPNATGGVDVTLTIPVLVFGLLDDDCSFFWVELEGILVLRGTVPACGDTLDNDGDGLVDFGRKHPWPASWDRADPGCARPESRLENPQCQDGGDNDGDGRIDFDGGRSAGLPIEQQTRPDLQCIGRPAKNSESRRCGFGLELLLLLISWLWGMGSGGGALAGGAFPFVFPRRRRSPP